MRWDCKEGERDALEFFKLDKMGDELFLNILTKFNLNMAVDMTTTHRSRALYLTQVIISRSSDLERPHVESHLPST